MVEEDKNLGDVVKDKLTEMNQEIQKQRDKIYKGRNLTDKVTGKFKEYVGGAAGAGLVGAAIAIPVPLIGPGVGFLTGATGYIAYKIHRAAKRRKGKE